MCLSNYLNTTRLSLWLSMCSSAQMAVTELSSGSSSSLRAAASSSASSASSPVSTTRKSHLHSRSDNHLHTFFFIRDICKHLHSYLLRLIERVVSVHTANVSPEREREGRCEVPQKLRSNLRGLRAAGVNSVPVVVWLEEHRILLVPMATDGDARGVCATSW